MKKLLLLFPIILFVAGCSMSEQSSNKQSVAVIHNLTAEKADKSAYKAYGDGRSHPLKKKFSTRLEAEKEYPFLRSYLRKYPNVDWKNLEVDFCAIQQSLMDGHETRIPPGTYLINRPIEQENMRLIGEGRGKSKLVQTDTTQPVLITGGVPYISDLYIGHSSLPSSKEKVPNGTGIYLKTGLRDGAVLERLYIESNTSGIYLRENSKVHLYSSSIRDIRITRFRHSAMYLASRGNTGNVISNIYAVNWNDYNKKTTLQAKYGMVLKGFDDGIIMQLNIEHGLYGKGIILSGSNIDLDSIHFEGYEPSENYGSFFYIDGDSKTTIRNTSLVYSRFDEKKAPNYSILSVGNNANIVMDGFRERKNNVIGSPRLRKFYGTSTIENKASIKADNFYMEDRLFRTDDYFPIHPVIPIVRQYNNERYFWMEGDTRHFVKSSMPQSGTYQKGDIVHNADAAKQLAKGKPFVEEWIRLTNGNRHILGKDWMEVKKQVK
jgi:hypothetical protein